jgi:hypothetical protein
MKKFITAFCAIGIVITALSTTALANIGDTIGYAKYTDISAYINHYPIASYNINDYTAIVAEDLRNYGFDVAWNGNDRSLSITRNNNARTGQNKRMYFCHSGFYTGQCKEFTYFV